MAGRRQFAADLSLALERTETSIRALASALGLHPGTVHTWTTGESGPQAGDLGAFPPSLRRELARIAAEREGVTGEAAESARAAAVAEARRHLEDVTAQLVAAAQAMERAR